MLLQGGLMMKLFLADINDIKLEYISMISPQRAQKARRYKKVDDQKRCIAGGLMIKRFLDGAEITENKYGKLVADNGVHFNLSHSGKYVLFALSDIDIGCDIEKVRSIDVYKAGRIVFGNNETDQIKESSDKMDAFLKLWTKKESLLKCLGEGFYRNAKSVDVSNDFYDENGERYYFKTWTFSDYVISVCSLKDEFPDDIEFISLAMD